MDSLLQEEKAGKSGSALFWGIMIVGVLLAGGLIAYFALQPTLPPQEVRLENAFREGQPEFDYFKQRIVVAENRDFTTEATSLAGGIQMQMRGVVRNFSEKSLTGLEVVATVVDQKGNPIREKKAIIVPSPQAQSVGTNKTAPFLVIIDGFSEKDDRANFSFKVTGIRVQ